MCFGIGAKAPHGCQRYPADTQPPEVLASETWPCARPPGVIQCTDRDEFSYQEMMTHLPLCALEVMPA
jgi:hypothetical protein